MRGVHGMQQLKDVYMGKDKVKLVMEYYPGKDLFDRVKYQGFIKNHSDLKKTVLSMAERIKTCHEMGISHNDIKMENFLLDCSGEPVLIDFGMSSFFSEGYRDVKLGTSYYAAPEFENGEFYKTSDVYSLGVVYGILLGYIGEHTIHHDFFKRMVSEDHTKRPLIDEVIEYVKK